MNFDEMILEAAKSIANATSALIKAASEAQKELVAQGKVSKKTHIGSEDGKLYILLCSSDLFSLYIRTTYLLLVVDNW